VTSGIDGQRGKLAGVQIPAGVGARERATLRRAVDESYVSGFRLAMLIAAGLAVVSAAIAFFFLGGKSGATLQQVPLASRDPGPRA